MVSEAKGAREHSRTLGASHSCDTQGEIGTVAPMTAGLLALLSSLFSPPSAAGLEADVAALLADRCSLCHDADSDNVDLTVAPSTLATVAASTGAAIVAPGDPANSYLLAKLTGQGIKGEVMPMGDDPLSVEELTLIQTWIAGMEAPASSDTDDRSAGEPANAGDADQSVDGCDESEGKCEDAQVAAPSQPLPLIAPPKKARTNFAGTHQINLHTTTTLGEKTLEFRVHHRFGQISAPRSYMGLAGGAVMSLGLAYGIIDGLDAMVRWSNSRLDWEMGLKYAPIRQVDGKPLSLSVYGSLEALHDFPDRSANRLTGNLQASASRLWFDRWGTQFTVNYSMLTDHSPNPQTDFGDGAGPVASVDKRGTLDLGLASTYWLGEKRKWGVDLEYILPVPAGGSPNLFYYAGGDTLGGPSYGGVSLGASARTGGHFFQVFISNVQNIHTNQVAPGASGRIEKGELFMGFNLSRKWKL